MLEVSGSSLLWMLLPVVGVGLEACQGYLVREACICVLVGGAWFQCRYGGFWMSSCQLMFPGVRSFLVFSSFGFMPPASGFQSYS